MSLTNDQVIRIHAALDGFVQADKQFHFDTTKAFRYAMAKNLNAVIPIIDDYSKQHNALVAKNGRKDKTGQYVVDDDKAKAVFTIERQDLGQQETAIAEITKIHYEDAPNGLPIDLLGLLIKTGVVI
jgi:hypothetical protein